MMSLIRSFPFVLLLLCVSFIAAAPLSQQNPSLDKLARRNEASDLSSLVERSSDHDGFWNRAIEEDNLFPRGISSRSVEHVENIILVRRESVGAKIKHAFQKVGKGIKKGFEKVGAGIKKAAKKVGEGVKTAAKKVAKFAKTTGAKIAKFGLEVVSTAESVASKVAKFIPGVGKPISAALTGMSKVTGLASDKIHANLGSKLQKGMDVMKKIQNPVGGAAGKVLNALRREMAEDAVLFERDTA